MAKRNRGRADDTMFGNLSDAPTLSETDDSIFGTGQSLSGKYLRAVPTDIFKIYPDVTQPRRAIPFRVRGDWMPNPAELPQFLHQWVSECEINPSDYLYPEATFERPSFGADETDKTSLVNLLDLAASIKHDELLNPITVTQEDDRYRIETGERRWVAYHLLHQFDNTPDKWRNIPARVVDNFSVWRQAAENATRDDLNAVGMARQLATLLMTIYRDEKGAEFYALDAFDHEREFYAQVADGEAYRIPQGYGERLLAVMGLKNTTQLRQYRAILRVSNIYWEEADDNNYAEGLIRKYMEGETSKSAKKPKKRRDAFGFKQFKKHSSTVEKVLGRLQSKGSLSASEQSRLQESMDAIRAWLDDTEQLVESQ